METIQIVLDRELLQQTDRAAQESKQDRSSLIREALRVYLRRIEVRELEERERQAYENTPQHVDLDPDWEAEAVWPRE